MESIYECYALTPAQVRHLSPWKVNPLIKQLTSREGAQLVTEHLHAIAETGEIVVAELGSNIVGMACLNYVPRLTCKVAEIHDVVVDAEHRGKGIARQLIGLLIESAKQFKAAHIDLTSHPSRISGNRLYRSLGFKIRETNCYRLTL